MYFFTSTSNVFIDKSEGWPASNSNLKIINTTTAQFLLCNMNTSQPLAPYWDNLGCKLRFTASSYVSLNMWDFYKDLGTYHQPSEQRLAILQP